MEKLLKLLKQCVLQSLCGGYAKKITVIIKKKNVKEYYEEGPGLRTLGLQSIIKLI